MTIRSHLRATRHVLRARGWPGWTALLAAAFSSAAEAQNDDALSAVRQADVRLATIGWRLSSANAALCRRVEPGTGLVLHSLKAYGGADRARVRARFRFASALAVEGVVGGSPADAVGIKADDSISSVAALTFDALPPENGAASNEDLVRVSAEIARMPPTVPIAITILRPGAAGPLRLTINPVTTCRARFEMMLDDRFGASASPGLVQIGHGFLDAYDDALVAVVVAHELAHLVLDHRSILRPSNGAASATVRQTEIEADQLSVYLLANAGWDPQNAARFWRLYGPDHGCTSLCGSNHPGWKRRAAALEMEALSIPTGAVRLLFPASLAARLREPA